MLRNFFIGAMTLTLCVCISPPASKGTSSFSLTSASSFLPGPPEVHPQIVNRVLRFAANCYGMPLGHCYQKYHEGTITVELTVVSGVDAVLLTVDGVGTVLVLSDL